MKLKPSGIILTTILVGAALVAIVVFGFHGSRVAIQPFRDQAVSLFGLSGLLREWARDIGHWRQLAAENNKLRQQIQIQMVDAARLEAAEQENSDLRTALNLSYALQRKVVPAGIFSILLVADGYSALINRGAQDGLQEGDSVVSIEGLLIGVVQEVFSSSARVTLVSDPSFKITAKILNRPTTGIARGALGAGMRLELIVQSDVIEEGDVLVSSGDDMTPGGLVIGVVEAITTSDAQIFKSVIIKPAAEFNTGQVLIIQ